MLQEESKRKKNKHKVKQIISEIALDLFFMKGLNGTSVAEIMGKAGLGIGTFYNYFTSKEEVLKYCLSKNIDMASQACENIQLSPLNPTQKLIQILQVVGNTYDINQHLIGLYLRYYQSPDNNSREPPHGKRFITVMAKIIAEGQNKNEFRTDIPCAIIVEMFAGILKITMSSNVELTFAENINFKCSMLLNGIVKKEK